jgi:hypothetical protein
MAAIHVDIRQPVYLGNPQAHNENTHTDYLSNIPGLYYTRYPSVEAIQRYRQLVSNEDQPSDFATHYKPVFVGQVPNLLPIPHLAWSLDLVLESYELVYVAQGKKNGCAKAWLVSEAARELLCQRTKTLMFDVCGVWVARTEEAKKRLEDYSLRIRNNEIRIDQRVPKSSIVFEPLGRPKPNGPPVPALTSTTQSSSSSQQHPHHSNDSAPPPAHASFGGMQQQQQPRTSAAGGGSSAAVGGMPLRLPPTGSTQSFSTSGASAATVAEYQSATRFTVTSQ